MELASHSLDVPADDDHMVVETTERRGQQRQIATLRLAKLRSGGREGWGFVKNLSESGMMLEVYPEFELGESAEIFVSEDKCVSGKVKWRKDGLAGVEFLDPVDIAEILKIAPVSSSGKVARLPRVHMRHPVRIKSGNVVIDGSICDISPAGMCVATDIILDPAKPLTMMVPQLADIGGTVRWQSEGRLGISFDERISIRNLMNWLSSYYSTTASHPAEPAPAEPGVADSAPLEPVTYHIVGHDACGHKVPVATMASATLALVNLKAAADYFDRVSVTNEDGVELLLLTLRLRAIQEEKWKAQMQALPRQP